MLTSQRDKAQALLTQLMQDANAWRHVDSILEGSTNQLVHFYATQILEHAIKFRWGTLPKDQREGVRNYLVKKIIAVRLSSFIMLDGSHCLCMSSA